MFGAGQRRFGLLILDEHEIYLDDWAVSLTLTAIDSHQSNYQPPPYRQSPHASSSSSPPPSRSPTWSSAGGGGIDTGKSGGVASVPVIDNLKGRLRLCSKSIIFEPSSASREILKFYFERFTMLEVSNDKYSLVLESPEFTRVPVSIFNGETRIVRPVAVDKASVYFSSNAAAGTGGVTSGMTPLIMHNTTATSQGGLGGTDRLGHPLLQEGRASLRYLFRATLSSQYGEVGPQMTMVKRLSDATGLLNASAPSYIVEGGAISETARRRMLAQATQQTARSPLGESSRELGDQRKASSSSSSSSQDQSDVALTGEQMSRASVVGELLASLSERIDFDCGQLDYREKVLLPPRGIWVQSLRPLVHHRGLLQLTQVALYFQPVPNFDNKPYQQILLKNVKHVFRRSFALKPTALEIISVTGGISGQAMSHSSTIFYFDQPGPVSLVVAQLERLLPEAFEAHSSSSIRDRMTLLWQRGQISTFHYLDYLNYIAGRSRNEFSQFPIYPWVLSDYESPSISLASPHSYRDLSQPIGALNPTRLANLKERMAHMEESIGDKFLYGSHYSTAVFVVHFLVRLYPECQLRLHGGRFDSRNRMFSSIAQTWKTVTSGQASYMELIPNFYEGAGKKSISSLATPTFLTNSLGVSTCAGNLQDVQLPPWAAAGGPAAFLRTMRAGLESEYVSRNISHWIDLVFGYKQRGREALLANNLFHPLTYANSAVAVSSGICPLGVETPQSPAVQELIRTSDVESLATQVVEFGQTPIQLFASPHPPRLCSPAWESNLHFSHDPLQNAPWFVFLDAHPELLAMGSSTIPRMSDPGNPPLADTGRVGTAVDGMASDSPVSSTAAGDTTTTTKWIDNVIASGDGYDADPSARQRRRGRKIRGEEDQDDTGDDDARVSHDASDRALFLNCNDDGGTGVVGVVTGRTRHSRVAGPGLYSAQHLRYLPGRRKLAILEEVGICTGGMHSGKGAMLGGEGGVSSATRVLGSRRVVSAGCCSGETVYAVGYDGMLRCFRADDIITARSSSDNAAVRGGNDAGEAKGVTSSQEDGAAGGGSFPNSTGGIGGCCLIPRCRTIPLSKNALSCISPLSENRDNGVFVVGGFDSSIMLFDRRRETAGSDFFTTSGARSGPTGGAGRGAVIDRKIVHADTVSCLAVESGNVVVSGSLDQSVCVSDATPAALEVVSTFDGHTHEVTAVACGGGSDRNLVLTGDSGGEICLWDRRVKSGWRPVKRFRAAAASDASTGSPSPCAVIHTAISSQKLLYVYDTAEPKLFPARPRSRIATNAVNILGQSRPPNGGNIVSSNAGGRDVEDSGGGVISVDLRMMSSYALPSSAMTIRARDLNLTVGVDQKNKFDAMIPGRTTAESANPVLQKPDGIGSGLSPSSSLGGAKVIITCAVSDGADLVIVGGVAVFAEGGIDTGGVTDAGGMIAKNFACMLDVSCGEMRQCWTLSRFGGGGDKKKQGTVDSRGAGCPVAMLPVLHGGQDAEARDDAEWRAMLTLYQNGEVDVIGHRV